MGQSIDTQPIIANIVNQMGSFIGCALAKEASQRYMKPQRAFRAVQDGIQAINEVATNANYANSGMVVNQFTGQAYHPDPPQPPAPPAAPAKAKPDHSKLDKKEFYQFKNQVFDKLDQIATSVAVTTE